MEKLRKGLIGPFRISIAFFITILFQPTFASSEEIYKFERMWPTLQQPWYFFSPQGTAVGKNNVYIADTANHRVQKLTRDGQLVTKWGGNGAGDGKFLLPAAAAVDRNENIYVIDYINHRIQKFNSEGQFISKWGSEGSGNGEFKFAPTKGYADTWCGIGIDIDGNIYVSDSGNNRIQKFTSEGQFITAWGSAGSQDGQFNLPSGIAIDPQTNIYVVDNGNHRIQKFNAVGEFVLKWGSEGAGKDQLQSPKGIAIDNQGNILLSDSWNNRIQKYDFQGNLISSWPDISKRGVPVGLAVDAEDYIYVAIDEGDSSILKLSKDGIAVAQWGSGFGDGRFLLPTGIAIDSSGNIHVIDKYRGLIQKFTPEGALISKWGSSDTGDGEFGLVHYMAFDSNGNIYTTDQYYDCVQKFTPDGQFITKWGTNGSGNGEFKDLHGIAIDRWGYIYVVDSGNDRIQKFSSDGQFIDKWGSEGSGNGQFQCPRDIVVNGDGFVFVTDNCSQRLQKFTSDGQFVTHWESSGWGLAIGEDGNLLTVEDTGIRKFTSEGQPILSFGEEGSDPGQFRLPHDLAVDPNGKIFIADSGNKRIQVLRKVSLLSNHKAVIVAGGGPFPGNNLWEATQMCANFAYRTLTYQGFTKESIYYLSSDTDLDLDNNGVLDDVDGDSTNQNLQAAIRSWAADADSLVVYLVDHGGSSTFRMSGSEVLNASDLDLWLDQVQKEILDKVIVIYDACESGSFLSTLTPPIGKDRIVITSTSPGQNAYFVSQGSVSFSNFFWTQIFNGIDINKSFNLAKNAIEHTIDLQNPLLDANGNGASNEPEDYALTQNIFIGNGTVVQGDVPIIESVSGPQTIIGTTSALLFALGVTDDDGIARVWGVIRPPGYNQESSDNPVQELPYFDFLPVGGDRYEGTFDGFTKEGTYHIAIYARDRIGNTSIPKLTSVSVENPLTKKAIIIVGGAPSDSIWFALENATELAYEAMKFQGYTDDDIYFMSPVTFSAGVDGLSTLSNLSYALNTWARNNTQDLVLYLIGNGNFGSFQINATETLYASVLDGWLDNLQNNMPGMVTVIYDACQSGSFLSFLKPPVNKERILLASAGGNQSACFLSNGDITFSKYFWTRSLNGATVRDAFLHAKQAVEFTTAFLQPGAVVAQLDDNGNGLGNEKSDGQIASNYTIGVGIILAGDDPLIGSICQQQTLPSGAFATIWVDDVTTTGSMDSVWAIITPPGLSTGSSSDPLIDMPTIELYHTEGNRYEGVYSNFNSIGTYKIAVYAMDTEGAISLPKETSVCFEACSDDFEDDDRFYAANGIVINAVNPQLHNFHDTGDQDWVKFYGIAGETYTIAIDNAGSNCDSIIAVYDIDGFTKLNERDDNGAGEDEELAWVCPADGIYYVQIKQFDLNVFGENTEYELRVYKPIGPLAGFVTGVTTDALTAQALGDVQIKTNSNQTALSISTGDYLIVHPPGTYTVTAEKSGYGAKVITGVEIYEGGETPLDIVLVPIDSDNDGISDVVENSVLCLDAYDDDSDDDGILDGNEDTDHDGVVDNGETDPCKEDTDNDGLLDGTETGLTSPQGSDTDLGIFIPDADPTTTTDPLNDDSDNDGWLDGKEDRNRNGRVDAGEKDPNKFDVKPLPLIPLLLLHD